jgi:hypothetical protein
MRRSLLTPLVWLLTIALSLALGAWAARVAMTPPAAIGNSSTPALYTVSIGTVSRILTFTAEATWEGSPVGRNSAAGTVTTVDVAPGEEVGAGAHLYSVDLRPVIAASGTVPAFRSLFKGNRGVDVSQLQAFLADAGFYMRSPSGRFDAATVDAVVAWQKSLRLAADGIVRRGDLVFFPTLPTRVRPAPALVIGALIAPGDVALEALPAAPNFVIKLSAGQSSLVPLSGQVLVHHGDGQWDAQIATSTTSAQGELVLELTGVGGGAVCGGDCIEVPVGSSALYRVDVVSVPETRGPLVPSAALLTKPDGQVYVLNESGREVSVVVVAAADGRAVVKGIDAGTVVRLFGEEPSELPTVSPAQ